MTLNKLCMTAHCNLHRQYEGSLKQAWSITTDFAEQCTSKMSESNNSNDVM